MTVQNLAGWLNVDARQRTSAHGLGLVMAAIALTGQPVEAAEKVLAYVASAWGNSVSVIDTDSNKVVATLTFSNCDGPVNESCRPGRIAMQPDGRRGYITLGYPAGLAGGAVAVLDAEHLTVTYRVPVGQNPGSIALTPDGTRAYVSNINDRTVSVVDTLGESVIATIPIGYHVLDLAISPDGRHVYAPENDNGQVGIIDTATNTLAGAIDVGHDETYGRAPAGVAVTPNGKGVYIVNMGWGTVSVADAVSNSIVATINPPKRDSIPSGIAVSSDGKTAYNVNSQPQDLQEIDVSSNTMRDTGLLIPHATTIALTPDGAKAYIATAVANIVYVIDLHGDTMIAKIPVGESPTGIALAPAAGAWSAPAGSIENISVTRRPAVLATPSPPQTGSPKVMTSTPRPSDPAEGTRAAPSSPGQCNLNGCSPRLRLHSEYLSARAGDRRERQVEVDRRKATPRRQARTRSSRRNRNAVEAVTDATTSVRCC